MSNTKNFTHLLGAAIALALSGEKGVIIGRAEYALSEDSYLIRYVDATGRQQTEWFGESALDNDNTDTISPTQAAASLPAPVGNIPVVTNTLDTAQPVASTSTGPKDKRGMPWDERIHASTKTINADGTWRNKKGVDKELLASVEAALLGTVTAVAPVVAAPMPQLPGMPPLPGVAAAPAEAPEYTAFVGFVARNTPPITPDYLKAVLLQYGVADGTLQNLAHNVSLIPAIETGLRSVIPTAK